MGERRRRERGEDQARDGSSPGDETGDRGPAPEVALERRPFGFNGQVGRSDVRAHRDGEQPDQQTVRRGPAGFETRDEMSTGHPDGAGSHRGRAGRHEKGRDDAGASKCHAPR